jgi:GntR family transcriptional regulator
MPLETRSQYRQLADLLRQAIDRGDYPPGSVMPSEDELARRHKISRPTANRALSILRSEGLVRVERGRGTIVRELPVITRNAALRFAIRESGDARGAFQAELERLGLTARATVDVSRAPAPDDVAEILGVPPRAKVLTRAREMFANDVPVQLATSWLPLDIAAGTQLEQADTGPGGAYSRLADLGYAPERLTESVRVRLPEDNETRFLRLDVDQRVLFIRRVAQTAAGRAVEVTDSVIAAHQWELVYDWSAAPGV